MTNLNSAISRKSFLQITAGALAGAAFLNVPQLAFAAGAKAKPCKLSALPEAIALADGSELVQLSYKKIKESVNTIQDSKLRRMTLDIVNNPVPTFMNQYSVPGRSKAVYEKLAGLGLINLQKTPFDKFLPPYNGKAPQPFYSAPGSGYGSHHAYPGGLATHTAVNLQISESIYDTYVSLFNSSLSRDIVISAQALHDLAKPFVFQWQENQASLTEYQIAGTGAHHIFSLAEVIYRGFPAEEIVAQACAHTIPTGKDEQVVVGYLTAAAIIAGKDAKEIGIVTADNTLPAPHKQEGYITSLGDHDFVLSVPACQKSVAILKEIAAKDYGFTPAQLNGKEFNKFRNYVGAQLSMMYVNSLSSEPNGTEKIRSVVRSLILK